MRLCFVQLALAFQACARPPRQPQATYLKVPEVPSPPNFGLADLLRRHTLADLDSNGDGEVSEAEFVIFSEARFHAAALKAWSVIDSNGDGKLDLEELVAVVQKSWVENKKKRFAPKKQIWPFLSALATYFAGIDLSRSARIEASAMHTHVAAVLRSVPFLDERRALFDEVAGAGVGDEDGSFPASAWEAWRESADKRKKSKSKGGTKSRSSGGEAEL
eukprot:TRINITY_DN99248_c0_g1_i1.p1 TRINITY_DN99248_c0_g1~~TRINITY_DN99248_c0_g1_i1.p1  ORF type:complete len:218 (+),score=46.02 TRINITY_DN99248_c0_g1_i1:53-706(+)